MPFFNKFGGGSSRSFGFGKAMAPQSAPTSLSAVPSNTSVAISFTAPVSDGGSAITNYEYSFNNSSWTALSPADATSPITISGLTQNTAYTIYLRAVNSVGAGPASTGVSFTTDGVPTGTTTISSVSSISYTTATVNFSTTAGGGAVTGYDYYLTSWVDAGVSSSPKNLSGLSAGTSYTVYMRPKNAYGFGPQSAGYTFTTLQYAPTSVEYLVVAGAGGGGGDRGGGGGAGGYLTSTAGVSSGASYTVTVGGGGGGAGGFGANGGNSVFSSVTAIGGGGGGGGGGGSNIHGRDGGSGGGSRDQSGANAGLGTAGQGNNGGGPGSVGPCAAGGGGASSAGSAGKYNGNGSGGAGAYSSITGASTAYAGGGGGGGESDTAGVGGVGGGANGGYGANGGNGVGNTGGGGGGGSGFGGITGGNGGSGVVIVAYPSSFAPLTSIGAGLAYSVSTSSRAGYRVYTFTGGTGSITV